MEAYLAPAHVYRNEALQVTREPGVATRMAFQMVPGMSCQWPASVRVHVVDDSTPASWERISLACVPAGADLPLEAILGVVIFSSPRVTDPVVYVVNYDDYPDWEPLDLARVPDDFWANYGQFYQTTHSAEYLPADYRVRLRFQKPLEAVPPTWTRV